MRLQPRLQPRTGRSGSPNAAPSESQNSNPVVGEADGRQFEEPRRRLDEAEIGEPIQSSVHAMPAAKLRRENWTPRVGEQYPPEVYYRQEQKT